MRPEIRPIKHSHPFRIALIIITVAVLIGAIALWQKFGTPPHILTQNPELENGAGTLAITEPAINGMAVDPAVARRRPIGVMIENSPEARPQSGLDEADIVYETVAEGGITRFLALYQTESPASIGPVRSARDYYAHIADEWGVLFAHIGGSDEVLAQLAAGRYKNLDDANQFSYGAYFERIASRLAPHNVYTSLEKLRAIIEDEKLSDTARYDSWRFNNADAQSSTDAHSIANKFSGSLFDVRYEYNPETKSYQRFLANKPHIDAATKQQLAAQTVIVQYVPISATPNDPKNRVDIGLTGQGKAFIFHNGRVIQGQWKKGKDNRTRYYDQDGNEALLAPGKIWIALAASGSMTYKPGVANPTPNQ